MSLDERYWHVDYTIIHPVTSVTGQKGGAECTYILGRWYGRWPIRCAAHYWAGVPRVSPAS
jgi:hypothetical protein